MRNVWCYQVPSCFFQTLERLTLYRCNEIISLFSSTMGENLVNLHYLSIDGCFRMKEVFIRTGGNEEGKTSIVTFPKLKVLRLCHLLRLTSLGKGIQSIELPMLEELKINGCPNLTSIASLMEMERNRKSRGLQRIASSVTIFGSKEFICEKEEEEEVEEENWCDWRCALFCDKKVKVSGLKHLELWQYPGRKIWCHDIPLCSFRKLERLEICGCRNIESVFSYSMAENLVELNELSIKWCAGVKAVCAMQEKEDKRRKSHVITFPNLKRLKLEGLESLRYMVTLGEETKRIEFPMLYDLKIKACRKLRSLVGFPFAFESSDEECIRHDCEAGHALLCDQKIQLSGLGSIEIYCCDNIKSVFSSPLVESLTRLKHLAIAGCENMKKVIAGDKGMHGNSVLLPSLEMLVLRDLDLLEMFCEWSCALEFPLLEAISVIHCSNLKVLTPGSIQTPKLNKMKVDDRRIKTELLKEMKDLNSFLRRYNRLERQRTVVLSRDTDTEFSKYESDEERQEFDLRYLSY